MAWMRALFVDLAREAGLDRPEHLGAQLHLLYEGAAVALTAGGHGVAVTEPRQAAARLMGR